MVVFFYLHYFLFSGAGRLLTLKQQDDYNSYSLFKIMLSFFLSLVKEYAI